MSISRKYQEECITERTRRLARCIIIKHVNERFLWKFQAKSKQSFSIQIRTRVQPMTQSTSQQRSRQFDTRYRPEDGMDDIEVVVFSKFTEFGQEGSHWFGMFA